MRQTSYCTLKQNSIKYMLKYVDEYEQVKSKKHPEFILIKDFFRARQICFQNFYKFYKRYLQADRKPEALLPIRRGPRPKYLEMPIGQDSLEETVLNYRKQGHNRYVIAKALKERFGHEKSCSPSTVYRILKAQGLSRLTPPIIEEKRRIVRETAGSLAHIDCHYLPKGILQNEPQKRYFVLGVIDDFSRIVWVEVIPSLTALDVTFAMLDAITILNQRYNMVFEEALTDNGSEFCGGVKTMDQHPFERLLQHFSIKHRKTKPYRPQTNGKIERFWRSFDEEVIDGSEFADLDALKNAVLGYNFYFNEHRPHQGIDGQTPLSKIKIELK